MNSVVQQKKVKKPTLKDIAALSGLSVPTVSQILNNKANNFCAEDKKRMVRNIARELNYQPNFGYQIMTGKRTNTVGIICSQERVRQDEYITELLLKLSSELEKMGNATYMATLTADHPAADLNKINNLVSRGCSAFIFIGNPMNHQEVEQELQRHDIHYIGFNSNQMQRNVVVDCSIAYESYIRKFINEGRTNFKIFLIDKFEHSKNYNRAHGLYRVFPNEEKAVLYKRYISLLPKPPLELPNFGEHLFQVGYEVTKKIFEQDKTLQGLAFATDYYALGAAKYFTEIGVKIGEDVALCGYNNTDAVKFASLPISTADHQQDKISDMLIKNLKSNNPLKIVMEPRVILK
ncbi:MAG: LacI family transcriptional regulator [Victivallaceae bacterium]|nr:LacI family transcriptional regulator [Victivallaceae bacterium]